MEHLTKNDQLSTLLHHSARLPEAFFARLEMQGIYLGDGYFFELLFYWRPGTDWGGGMFSELERQFTQMFFGKYLMHWGQVDGNLVYLFCFPHAAADSEVYEARRTVETALSARQEFFQDGTASVIIGPVCQGKLELTAIHRLCVERQDFFYFMADAPDVFSFDLRADHMSAGAQFDDMKQSSKLAYLFAMDVKNGTLNETLMQRFYIFMLPEDVKSLPMIHYRIQTFLNFFLLTLDEYRIIDRQFLTQHAVYQHLTSAETLAKFKQMFTAFIQDILALARTSKHGSSPLKSRQAADYKAYIDRNLQLPTLDVAHAARELNISQPLLSAVFKREYGVAPSEYIRTQRVRMAKELLVRTDKTLYEIMLEIGFVSLSTFQRAFRQLEGTTPGQYRMICRKKGDT